MGQNGTLDQAKSLHRMGRLAEAETLYRAVLQAQPGELEAMEGLGILLFHLGRVDEARALFAQAAMLSPNSARLHANLSEVLRTLGRFDDARDEVQKALDLEPGLAQSWNALGLLEYDQRRFEEALRAYEQAIRLSPRFVPALINLGTALVSLHRRAEAAEALRAAIRIQPDSLLALAKLGRVLWELRDPDALDEAETHSRRALALAPGFPDVLETLGHVLRFKGRLGEAIECYTQALKRAPRRLSIHLSLGELLQGSGRGDEAARVFKEAESLDPNDARLRTQLGTLAFARGRFGEAAEEFRAALVFDASLAEAHSGLGLALQEQGLVDEAEGCFREALRSDPGISIPWIALARLQADRGDWDQSCQTARQALALHPNLAEAYWRLAMNLKGALPDSDVHAMQRLREHKYVPHSLRAGLNFALGAVFDSRGLYVQAAEHFEAANALEAAVRAAKNQSFNPEQYSCMIDRVIATFSSDLLARGQGWGDPDPRPVFVVGLPRSGTTLVEQILASHSQVHGAGELRDAISLFNALPGLVGQPSADAFEAMSTLDLDSARQAARRYLATLDRLAPAGARRVVDKMPDNFHLLGMIALLWPKARVIVCSRDLRDIALSCWQTSFATNPWTNRWDHIARRFADHERLLAHWKRTRPVAWLDVVYEELVRDLEAQARRLITFLGLEWEPACLEFHKTRRIVRTASQLQVRAPIHTRSVGRWRRYESTLQPLIEAFRQFGIDAEKAAHASH